MSFNPNTLAILYYFGDLSYWKLPEIAADALEHGFDGASLRGLAALTNPVAADIQPHEIDSAFREMGILAPISKEVARLTLAAEAAKKALSGQSNVFDEATHIRIHLCNFSEVPPELSRIVTLSKEAQHAPRTKWEHIERDLTDAMSEFVSSHK
jgi:hypothetical protein